MTNLRKKIKNEWLKLLLAYTLLFSVMLYFCWLRTYLLKGKNFIWEIDGLEQEYSIFVYIHEYVYKMARILVNEHRLSLPFWDYTIGYGSDIYVTLTWGGLYDPIKILFASLSHFSSLEDAFRAMVIFKFYLVGISFIALAKYKNKGNIAALIGTFIYTFANTTSMGLVHASFLNTFIIFPLVMIAVDRLWSRRFSIFYIIIIAISIADNFYFFYMMSIAVVVYCLHKYFLYDFKKNKDIRVFLKFVVKYLYHSLLGVSLSAFLYWPTIKNLLSMERIGIERKISFFYDKSYYAAIVQGFVDVYDSGNDWFLGFSSISLLFTALLFVLGKTKHTILKINFFELTLGLLIPYVGHIMNGMSYVSNRWVFIYLLCVSYIAATVADEINHFSERMINWSLIIMLGYGAMAVLYFRNYSERLIVAIAFALFSAVALWLIVEYGNLLVKNAVRPILLVLCLVSLYISASYQYGITTGYFIDSSVNKGEANNMILASNAQEMLLDVDEKEASRFDIKNIWYKRNASWAHGNGHSCMDMYLSLYNNCIDKMSKNLAIISEPFSFSYHGVDSRSELDMLYGVKYFIVKDGDNGVLPVGYTKLLKKGNSFGNEYLVFQPETTVEMAYLFDKAVGYDSYLDLTPFDRQQLIMNGVVLDSVNTNDFSDIELDNDRISYLTEDITKLESGEYLLSVDEENKQFVLKIDKNNKLPEEGELYIYLGDFQNIGNTNTSYITQVEVLDENGDLIGNSMFSSLTSKSQMYCQKHDWLLKLGVVDKCDRLRITIDAEGEYSLSDLEVYFRPKTEIMRNARNLQPVEDMKLYEDRMEILTKADEDKYLFVSQPYSEGWKAYVDGISTDVMKADDGFMAIRLLAGEHNVTFKYRTPGLFMALIISMISLIIFVGLCFYYSNSSIQEKSF